MKIAVDRIRAGARLRSIVPGKVEQLVESIAALGLQTPISVAEKTEYPDGQAQTFYLLVAGAHRLAAHKSLGLAEIEAVVCNLGDAERQLWEIDENLCRADLTELEQAEHLLKRQEIYEWWRPETRVGSSQARGMNKALGHNVDDNLSPTFAADTAAKTGIDQRTIQRATRRARKIDEGVRNRIRDNPEIADSGVELDALAQMDPQQQRKAVALIESGQAGGVRDAKKLIERTARPVAPNFKSAEREREKRQSAFTKALWALAPEDRDWAENMVAEFFDRPVADSAAALRLVK